MQDRVAIVGGGIGGLTAALALIRQGINVDVYEQAPELKELGAGIQISSNGTGVLYALGLVLWGTAKTDSPCGGAGIPRLKVQYVGVGEAAHDAAGLHPADRSRRRTDHLTTEVACSLYTQS
jgi:2-polyprenyl-6-methoxyphenol hydroxylase-like FAD-dependent oxidoreductase